MSLGMPRVAEALHERLAERYRTIDGQDLRRLAEAGLTWLRTNQQTVNSLNVFPVPDGDTGTNMSLTMQSACDEIADLGEHSISRVAKAVAHGALMGARGNSGVILSQLWRGFARALDDHATMDAAMMAGALAEARDTAYKGVVQPVEGTILTVAKDNAVAAREAIESGVWSTLQLLERVVDAADESVRRTPDLLPVLKEAGVVDSGGKGLFFMLEGMLRFAYGQPLDKPGATVQPLSSVAMQEAREAVEPGQDWEIVVDFHPSEELNLKAFYRRLEEMGTSIQLGEGDGIYRLHIHVPDEAQYRPVEYVQSLGSISKFTVENLADQVAERAAASKREGVKLANVEPGQLAVVAVAPGTGIGRVFASLGAAALVEGGQTMNPSTQEILAAVENLPTEKVIILPNNKNIVLAAQQAAELTARKLTVVPSVSVPQGIAALLAFDPNGDLEQVRLAMTSALAEVTTAELTVATRSVEIDGVDVVAGQVIGLLNGRLTASGQDLESTLMAVLEKAAAADAELITLYYGADLTPVQANQLADRVRQRYHAQEVEVVEGGQPHYHLIVSIE
jgi:hypothetical protein